MSSAGNQTHPFTGYDYYPLARLTESQVAEAYYLRKENGPYSIGPSFLAA